MLTTFLSTLATQQGKDGLRTTTTAFPGGTITVNVGPNDPSVEISNDSTGEVTTIPVERGKDTQVPIPNVPGGTVLFIRVGRGLRARIIIVEVVELFS